MREGDDDAEDGIPIGELSDEEVERPRRHRRSRRRVLVVTVAVALVAGVAAVAVQVTSDNGARRRVTTGTHRVATSLQDDQARVDVLSALNTTTAAHSFDIRFRLSEVPPGAPASTSGPNNVTISGTGTVIVHPTAMVTTSNVPGFGDITTRVDGSSVWETGGGNYGMTPGQSAGAGAPLSGFAGLVMGTLGPREGAVAMSNMASPTGYLDLAEQAITASSQLGDTMLDGMLVHQYEVGIDAVKVADRPELTAEELKARADALEVLQQQGYETTTVRLSIDTNGFIRRAQTIVRFSDGGTVTGDTNFSNFGCSSVVMLPAGPSIQLAPAGCTGAAAP